MSLLLLSYSGNQKVAMTENEVELQNIYNYKYEDIKNFLSNIKPNENYTIQKIFRNSSGTSLYIHYSADNIGDKVLIIPTNGQIREIDAPAKVVYLMTKAM